MPICSWIRYSPWTISLHPCISSLCRPLPDNHQKWIHIYKHFMRPASPNRPRLILHGQTEAVAFSESEQLLLFAFTQGDLTLLCRRNDAKVGHRDNTVSVNWYQTMTQCLLSVGRRHHRWPSIKASWLIVRIMCEFSWGMTIFTCR